MTAISDFRAYQIVMNLRWLVSTLVFAVGAYCVLLATHGVGFPTTMHHENVWSALEDVQEYRMMAFMLSIAVPVLYLLLLMTSEVEFHPLQAEKNNIFAKLPFNATSLVPFIGAAIIAYSGIPYVSPAWYQQNTMIETSPGAYRIFEDGTIVEGGHPPILITSVPPSSDVVPQENVYAFTKDGRVETGKGVAIYRYVYQVAVPAGDAVKSLISVNFDQFNVSSGYSAGTLVGLIKERGPDLMDAVGQVHQNVLEGQGSRASMLAQFDLLARPLIESAFAALDADVTITSIELVETQTE